jgi:tRNA modification GTPase
MTCAACLTPPGAAAIAVLAIRGRAAWEVVRGLFRPRSAAGRVLPEVPEIGRVWLGRLGADLADEVVLTVKEVVPLPWIEVHCHGGPEVIRFLLETFAEKGVCRCAWPDFLRRALADPLQAEAAIALSEARTSRTAGILLDQYHGAFRSAVLAVLETLQSADPARARRFLDDLARHISLGRHLTEPWRIVLAGAPNVGKSSLLNALAGYQRSIVTATPGTTRDVVTTQIALDGWPVELADTAGIRGEARPLEEQGIQRARAAAASADLCLWLLDASTPPVWPDPALKRVRLVVNKVDLSPVWDLQQACGASHVSALTGKGITELCQVLGEWLVPDPPPSGAAVPFTSWLCDRVEAARALSRVEQVGGAIALLQDLVVPDNTACSKRGKDVPRRPVGE